MQTESAVVSKLLGILETEKRGEPFASYRAGEVRVLWWMLSGEDVLSEDDVVAKLCARYNGEVTKEYAGKIKIALRNLPS